MKAEYSTRQRTQILDYLKDCSSHVTASEIVAHLRESGSNVSVATVYRTPDSLHKNGYVKKYVIDERSGACYEYAHGSECNAHFHLKCLKCGALIHLSCEFLEKMSSHILKDHGFTVSSGNTVIYGHCEKCSQSK
jgi:Fur family ferric uptake transcriptional regulator